MFIVSSVKETTLENEELEVSKVNVSASEGVKCERCWNKFDASLIHDNLCPRCKDAMEFYKDKINEE